MGKITYCMNFREGGVVLRYTQGMLYTRGAISYLRDDASYSSRSYFYTSHPRDFSCKGSQSGMKNLCVF